MTLEPNGRRYTTLATEVMLRGTQSAFVFCLVVNFLRFCQIEFVSNANVNKNKKDNKKTNPKHLYHRNTSDVPLSD